MATLAGITKPLTKPLQVGGAMPMPGAPSNDALQRALATGNQSGLAGSGSTGTNQALNDSFYQQGVATPWYQAHQVELNRQGPMFQQGGMFYNPAIDGGAPQGTPPTGGGTPGDATIMPVRGGAQQAPTLSGGPAPAAGAAPTDWSKVDVSKFLDPNMGFRIGEATNAVQNTAAAKGGLLSGATLRGVSDRANSIAGDEFDRATQRAMLDRDFQRGAFTNDRDYTEAGRRWQDTFNYGNFKDQRDFGENSRRYDQDFGESSRRYGIGLDQNDRDFAYRTQTGDRDFNYNSLRDIAQMGLSGTQGNGSLMAQLSQLLSGNTLLGAGAGAAGQTGGANAINNLLSQLFRYYGG